LAVKSLICKHQQQKTVNIININFHCNIKFYKIMNTVYPCPQSLIEISYNNSYVIYIFEPSNLCLTQRHLYYTDML